MYKSNIPKYPQYLSEDDSVISELTLSSFTGMQIRNGPYGALSSDQVSDGSIHVSIEKNSENKTNISLFKWVLQNEILIHESLLNYIFVIRPEIMKINQECGFVIDDYSKICTINELHKSIGIVLISIRSPDLESDPVLILEIGTEWHYDQHFCVIMNKLNPVKWDDCNSAYTDWYR